METLCRVCIKKAVEWTSLNTKIEDSPNLSFFDFLNKCTSLNACESDSLPQSLCSICTHSVKTFYSFVKLAEKSDIILRETLKNSITTEIYNDNREFSCEEITIKNENIEEESEDFTKADSFYCQASTNATGSSLYNLDIVKEEPLVSESTLIVAKINESDEFHSNLDHPEGSIEEPDNILSCLDGHPASIDNVPIYLLKRSVVTNKETDSQKTKIEYEDYIKTDYGCSNQVSIEAAADSFTGHTENSYKCKECDMVFNDKEEFETHCRNHVCGYKHECNICGKKFAKRRHLRNHLVTHDEKKKFKCSICGKEFKRSSCRWSHMRIHSVEKPFECDICSKKFKSKSDLKRHRENHSGITKKCGQCDKEFKHTQDLKNHIKWHANPKPFKCEKCGKLLARKCTYTRHMEICKPVGNSNDQTHQKGHTENTCTECNVTFNDKEEFETHCRNHGYEVIHDENKKYKCSICGKDFKHASTHRNHMRIHSGENPFECKICSKKFKAKSNLKRHIEIHSGITKKCGLCDKEFKNSNGLFKHMKWHTNPKTYKCENCGKSFVWKQSYIYHMPICKPLANSNEGTIAIEESSFHSKGNEEIILKVTP